MKIFKKVIAGVAALAIAVSGISFGALSRKEVNAATTKAAVVDGYVVDIPGTEIATLGSDLGTVQWNNDNGDAVELTDLSSYSNWAGKALIQVDYTTETGGQFYIADKSDWSKSTIWYNEGGTVYAMFTDGMVSNGIMINGEGCDITSVKLINCTVYDELAVLGENLGTVGWSGEIKIESSVFKALGEITLGDVVARVDFTPETGGGQFYFTHTQDWGASAVWYNDTVKNAAFPITEDIVNNGCMMNGGKIAIDKVSLYGIKATGVELDNSTITFTKNSEGFDKEPVTLNATVLPDNATLKNIEWSSSDETVATVDANGKITPVDVGTATITARVDDTVKATCEVNVEALKPTGITIVAVPTDVKGGDTVTLTATVTPANALDKTVTWSSSDTEVAKVDANGKVTFENISGTKTVTITAAAKADASVKATVTFTVEELVINTPVNGVTVSEDTLELVKGESADLAATVTPEDATLKTVIWESADETIATVDSDGKVTATGVGTTTITVKTVDGGKTATCEVTVTAPKATKVTVSVDGAEVDKLDMTAGDTANLIAKAEPDDAVQSFTFATSDEAIVTVDENGVITAVAEGTATITVTADGAAAEIEVTVTVKKDGSLDVDAKGEFKPAIEMSKEEVVAAIKNVLSEEQLAAIEDGTAKIEIELNIANIDDTVSQEDKDLIADAIKSITDSDKLNFMVMNYFDVTFGANVDGDVIKISETDGLITVSVALDKAVNGTYKVIRIHDGKAEVIDSELSEDGTRLTFKTDKFSTYAIVFADVASGDKTMPALIALLAIAGLAAALTVAVKIRKTARR